jgi:hypothetical protein
MAIRFLYINQWTTSMYELQNVVQCVQNVIEICMKPYKFVFQSYLSIAL